MYDNKDEYRQTKLPSEIIKDLKTDVAELEKEKNELEQKLLEEKKEFENKLAREIEKIEEEWADRLKKMASNKSTADEKKGFIEEEGGPLWMATYSDIVTLIMTFFILYYSKASMNMKKFKEAIIGEEQASIGL